MARDKHQCEYVVVDRIGVEQGVRSGLLRVEIAGEDRIPFVARGTTPEGIDGPPTADREQPSGRLGRHSVDGP